MLDPKVANLISKDLEAESIVVFDEAHNIDNVCIEALSVTLEKRLMDASLRSVTRLQTKVADLKASDRLDESSTVKIFRIPQLFHTLVLDCQESMPIWFVV